MIANFNMIMIKFLRFDTIKRKIEKLEANIHLLTNQYLINPKSIEAKLIEARSKTNLTKTYSPNVFKYQTEIFELVFFDNFFGKIHILFIFKFFR